MTPREHLREEHGRIMKVLSRFQAVIQSKKVQSKEVQSEKVQNGKEPGDRWIPALKAILDFLEISVDQSHHGKEEEVLFPALEALNNPELISLMTDLCRDHTTGHALLQDLKSEFYRMKKTGRFPTPEFINTSEKCIDLLRAHIRKENAQLLPELDRLLSDKEPAITASFESYERNVQGLERVRQAMENPANKSIRTAGEDR